MSHSELEGRNIIFSSLKETFHLQGIYLFLDYKLNCKHILSLEEKAAKDSKPNYRHELLYRVLTFS